MGRWLRLCATLVLAGCGTEPPSSPDDSGARDLVVVFPEIDIAMEQPDLTYCGNACGDCDPGCMGLTLGPDYGKMFPLSSDKPRDPNESDNRSLAPREKDGALLLNSPPYYGPPVWVANSTDWNRGTVSLLDPHTEKELARYFSVTCSSLPGGSADPCDGTKGCCALDDDPRWQARRGKQPEPPHQGVQLDGNSPSRTAIDFDGAVWIANRAPGGQASVTKIQIDPVKCGDWNGNLQLETSSDVNGDGAIETDCNHDGLPDDIASVKAAPCTNGLAQEFYGLDDECVTMTTNVGGPDLEARAIASGPGTTDFGPSDAWAATIDGRVFRVDGTSGLATDERQLPDGCIPWGMTSDSFVIGWAVTLGDGPLCWFDMRSNTVGVARVPQFGTQAWGISLDRDQSIWLGGLGSSDAYRYVPDRSNMLANLGAGWWTQVKGAGANAGAVGATHGIAADSRTQAAWFAWIGTDAGWIARIPGSTLGFPKMDQIVDGSTWPALALPGYGNLVVGVAYDENLWAASASTSTVIRISVDFNGNMTAPDLVSPPKGNARCPAGDRCSLRDVTDPGTDAYNNFLGYRGGDTFGLRAWYRYLVASGCPSGTTRWVQLSWDADVPLNTSFSAKTRSGSTPTPDMTWSDWNVDSFFSPVDLSALGGDFLQLELDISTMTKNSSPALHGVAIGWRCMK